MKLEVGKKYRTREGELVTVERKVTTTPHSYIGSNQCSYTENGLWLYTEHSSCDLIEEIQETKMKLEVGKKYRTVCGMIVTVKSRNSDPQYPCIVDVKGIDRWYSEDGLLYASDHHHGLNIIEEIKENTMFNKDYKYLCMDADGYNKAAFNRPAINTDMDCWVGYEDILQVGLFNLGDDWKESLREIVYNNDGSIYLRKPGHEFKVDDKVLVRGTGDTMWKKRHFSHWACNGKPRCFSNGATAYSANGTNIWNEIKPYVEEE